MSRLRDALDDFKVPLFAPLAKSPTIDLADEMELRESRQRALPDASGEVESALANGTEAELSRPALRFALGRPDLANKDFPNGFARIVAEARRRDDRPSARAAWSAYLIIFNPDDPSTALLSEAVKALTPRLSERVGAVLREHNLADPSRATIAVSDALAGEHDNVPILAMRPRIARSRLGAYAAAGTIEALRGSTDAIERILARMRDPQGRLVEPLTRYLYPALIRPFFDEPPPEPIKQKIVEWVREAYRDPRLPTTPKPQLADDAVANQCVETVRRWLAIETLQLFIEVIDRTADKQWERRRDFWLPYFEANMVGDVHVVFGSSARATAETIQGRKNPHMRWADLSGAGPDQSVLLMKIGGLSVAEWSHSGKLRFWPSKDPAAPILRKESFTGAELRNNSMIITDEFGRLYDGITHHADGKWRQRAARVIRENTGLRP